MQFDITLDLVVIGGAASVLVAVLKALLLDLENYPRIKALWRLLPSLLGALLVLFFPAAVPSAKSLLILGAHGFLSPLAFVLAYPLIEKKLGKSTLSLFPSASPSPNPEAEKKE